MSERIKTLVLDANGFGWRVIAADTLLRGILGLGGLQDIPPGLAKLPVLRRALKQHYDALSYVIDWREALVASPHLDAEIVNINDLVALSHSRRAVMEYPLVIVLHSAAGDSMSLLLNILGWFQKRRGKLVVFIGNEYSLLDEKLTFLRESGADYICSQLPADAARWLYDGVTANVRILSLPHALNPRLYTPGELRGRSIDLGFRGSRYPYFIGDKERNDMLDVVYDRAQQHGMIMDFGYKNIERAAWAEFLRSCKAIVGAEAGSYYLDRRGVLMERARDYERRHPNATFEEIFQKYFTLNLPEHVSNKCISSRHFEPVGTKTCQLLLEGSYNGILRPNEDYISLKKDYSNLDEALRMLMDEETRKSIVERAYKHVLAEHTYERRVQVLVETLLSDGL